MNDHTSIENNQNNSSTELDIIKQYQELGFHIEKNVFTPEECEELIRAGTHLNGFLNGYHRPAMMPHKENPFFLTAMKKPKIVELLSKFLNGKIAGLQSEFFYCKPDTRGFSLHQDNFFVEAPYDAFGSAWIALTDTYKEKGGLIVYPGSHKEGMLQVKSLDLNKDTNQDPNANNEEVILPEHYLKNRLNVSIPKGGVLFIHGHLVHGSNPNITQDWRYVLLNTYIRQGENFRSGRYAQRELIEL